MMKPVQAETFCDGRMCSGRSRLVDSCFALAAEGVVAMFTKSLVFRVTGVLVAAALVAMAIPTIASADLMADYEFEQNLNDSASNPANLTVHNGVTPTYVASGITGGGYAISMGYQGAGGLADELDSSASKLNLNGATSFTIEGYFRVASVQTYWNSTILMSTWYPYLLGIADNSVGDAWGLVFNGGAQVQCAGGSGIINDQWQYLALTSDGSTLTLYQNGNSVATTAFSGALNWASASFIINTTNQGYTGYVDSVKIWNECVSGDYIAARAGALTPEPSAIVLLSCGLVSLLAYAWRKRK
jgi:hypothetical protein